MLKAVSLASVIIASSGFLLYSAIARVSANSERRSSPILPKVALQASRAVVDSPVRCWLERVEVATFAQAVRFHLRHDRKENVVQDVVGGILFLFLERSVWAIREDNAVERRSALTWSTNRGWSRSDN